LNERHNSITIMLYSRQFVGAYNYYTMPYDTI